MTALLVDARRLFAEGAVRITAVAGDVLSAEVIDQGTYRVIRRPDGAWWCSCGLTGTCRHRLATKLAATTRQGSLL